MITMNRYIYICSKDQHIYIYIHTLVKHQRTCLLQQTEQKNVHLITCSLSQCQVIEVRTEIHMAVSQSTLESDVTNSFWWPQVLSHHKQNQFMIRLAMKFMMVFEKLPFLTIKQHLEMSQLIYFFIISKLQFEESHPSWFSRVVFKWWNLFLCPFKDRCFDTALICAML